MNYDIPDIRIGALLSEVTRLLRAEFNRRVQPLGLTQAQWRALASLSRQDGIRQGELADLLEIKPITVTRLVDRLESAGWVKRCPDPADRRAFRLHLTPDALPLLTKLWTQADALTEEVMAGLDESARRQVCESLILMKNNLLKLPAAVRPAAADDAAGEKR